MFDKLEALEERFQLVSEKISDPDIIADQESWRKYCKEHSDLTPIIDKYRELKSAKQTVADDKEMLELTLVIPNKSGYLKTVRLSLYLILCVLNSLIINHFK